MQQVFFTRREMMARGWSGKGLSAAVHSGELIRPRIGHYTAPTTPPDVVKSVRVGGVATATTGGKAVGLWTPDDEVLHVAVPKNAPRMRDPDDPDEDLTESAAVRVHRTPTAMPSRTRTGIAPVPMLLAHAFAVLRPELWLAMVDSALHLRHIRPDQLASIAAMLPAPATRILESADGLAESGIETVVRYLLRLRGLRGLRVDLQVTIPGIGRVDLLVEGRLIIEVDGREYHDGAFARDRARDLGAAAARYRVLRLTYRQILFDWPATEAAIFAALA